MRARHCPGSPVYAAREHTNIADDAAAAVAAIASSVPRGDVRRMCDLLNAVVGTPCADGVAPRGEWHALLLRDGVMCLAARVCVQCADEGDDHTLVAFYA